MKKVAAIICLLLLFANTNAQDITGKWNGMLKVQGMELRLVFHLTKSGDTYSAIMDSPDQGVSGIPMTTATFDNSEIKLTHSAASILYTGKYVSDEKITGTFVQSGQSFPMDLTREALEKSKLIRPQEPVKPYPYYSEDVVISNIADSLTLNGTLTLPTKEGKFPVVILISGSGPQNRDEELLGHKPFLVISDYLTRNGIGVMRYDDRGTGKSTGDFSKATSLDFASDVESVISYLKLRSEIDISRIGLVGHSEGALIAPMVASKSSDVAFIVMMAGTGVRGDELLLMQQEAIGKVSGISENDLKTLATINRGAFDIILNTTLPDSLNTKMVKYLNKVIDDFPENTVPPGMSREDFVNMVVNQSTSAWMHFFVRYNPAVDLQKVKCPVLAINGSNDLQVPATANLKAIEKALNEGGNNKVTIKELEGLNHLFQESNTGNPSEYATIEQTFSPIALEEILKWIKSTLKTL